MATEHRRTDRGPFSLYAFATAVAAVAVLASLVLTAAYLTCGFEGCPAVEEVSGYMPDEASVIMDRNGEEVGKLFRVHRVVVGIDSLPDHVTHAFVATEDRNFYRHRGVDARRVAGAAWQNVRTRGIAEGFSTITMQVARNLFPDRLPMLERTLNRKLAEIRVARQIERRYSKDEILELYLNQIYFGSGAWGIEAAAQEYFGKPATQLDLAESALLAGLPQAPSHLNPRQNLDGALERRETVIRRMEREGVIDADQAATIRESQPTLARSSIETPDRAAYFTEHVRRIMERVFGDELYIRGFRIHTTLDLAAQEAAELELGDQLRAIETGRYGYFPHRTYASAMADTVAAWDGTRTPYLQGAVVTMDVATGDVLTMVGGRDFDDSKFNRAAQARRQPGSAFKPFVYAAALEARFPPTTILEDRPYRLVRNGQVWEPRNYDGSYAGDITMRQALTRSQNIATIRLADQVGIDRVVAMAHALGINGTIPRYPSVAIGAAEVTLLDMVTAYSTLAGLGERPEPRFVTRVEDRDGNTIWREQPRTRRAISPDVAFLAIDLMRDVVDRGTGTAVRAVGFHHPAAGKTGTTNESADVWFIGSTPTVTTGVWIGMDRPQRIMRNATGGRLAAPVWGRIMRSVDARGGDWAAPAGVETHMVDAFGNVVGANCPTYGELRREYFIRGTVRAFECPGFRYDDSLYLDTIPHDGESWWRRLRDRVIGPEPADTAARPTTRPDTIIMRPPRQDTLRLEPQPPDTQPRPVRTDTLRRDTTRGPIGEPVDTLNAGGGGGETR